MYRERELGGKEDEQKNRTERLLTAPNNQAATGNTAIVTTLSRSRKMVSVALTRSGTTVAAASRARGRLGSAHVLSLDSLGSRIASRDGRPVLLRGRLLNSADTHFDGDGMSAEMKCSVLLRLLIGWLALPTTLGENG